MSDTGKVEKVKHTVTWDEDEMERIHQAAVKRGQETHLDLGPTDVIRAATRKYCDEVLGPIA